MTPIEKTKLQFDLQALNDAIQHSRCSRDLKELADEIIYRAEKALDDEPLNRVYVWKGTDL